MQHILPTRQHMSNQFKVLNTNYKAMEYEIGSSVRQNVSHMYCRPFGGATLKNRARLWTSLRPVNNDTRKYVGDP